MIILPSIYYYLELQQDDLKVRELTKGDEFIYKISDYKQTTNDIEKYATDQVAQPYEKGDIRITIPYLPYRVKGSLTGTWRIMLLQFVSIQDNYNNLKVTEGGTWVELVDAY